MKVHIKDAKAQFLQQWSNMAISWGVSRSMGQVHAYLLLATEPITYDDLKKGLNISQGNANNMIRELLDWGIVRRIAVPGERKEYFAAEKDMWKVAQLVAKARKRRELDPLVESLAVFQKIDGPKTEVAEFTKMIEGIKSVANIADTSLTLIEKTGVFSFLKMLS